jgi:hypothetical protein
VDTNEKIERKTLNLLERIHHACSVAESDTVELKLNNKDPEKDRWYLKKLAASGAIKAQPIFTSMEGIAAMMPDYKGPFRYSITRLNPKFEQLQAELAEKPHSLPPNQVSVRLIKEGNRIILLYKDTSITFHQFHPGSPGDLLFDYLFREPRETQTLSWIQHKVKGVEGVSDLRELVRKAGFTSTKLRNIFFPICTKKEIHFHPTAAHSEVVHLIPQLKRQKSGKLRQS